MGKRGGGGREEKREEGETVESRAKLPTTGERKGRWGPCFEDPKLKTWSSGPRLPLPGGGEAGQGPSLGELRGLTGVSPTIAGAEVGVEAPGPA